MGTTLTAAVIDGDQALIGHVGDSRLYLFREGTIKQITEDHSLVAELVAIGEITPDEAAIHPKRSIITRALGNDRSMGVDIYNLKLQANDRLLLCTDGLSGMLTDAGIAKLLRAHPDSQAAADELTEAALRAGGSDNVSVIVIDIRAVRPSKAGTAAALAAGSVAASTDSTAEKTALAKRRRRSRLGVITFIVLFALLIFGAVGGVWLYASNTAFLRLEDNQVCVYRGLPGDILPGVRLEWLDSTTELTGDDLLTTTADEMTHGIRFDSLNAAYARVADLQALHDEKVAANAIIEQEIEAAKTDGASSGSGSGAADVGGGGVGVSGDRSADGLQTAEATPTSEEPT
jgi:protein phosphatase